MIAGLAKHWVATAAADISALRASWASVRGGWPAAWRDAARLARHRQIVVKTPPDAQPVLCTRIRLSGETETCVLRTWLAGRSWKEAEPTVTKHFEAVAAAIGGWPAALGMARLGSRIVGTGGLILAAEQAIRGLLNHGPAALLPTALANWPLLVGLSFLIIGFVGRPILRRWLRAMIRRVPLRVPAPS